MSKILDSVESMLNSRPGLEFCNYGHMPSYNQDRREVYNQLKDGRILLQAVKGMNMTDEQLVVYFPKNNRLAWNSYSESLEYTVGQYYCTKYRSAICRALAGIVWNSYKYEDYSKVNITKYYDMVRLFMRNRFGRRIVKNYM